MCLHQSLRLTDRSPAQVNEVFLDHTSLGAPLLVRGASPACGFEAALA